MKKSILLFCLEFPTWARAKHLTYCAQLGLEEGLSAQQVEFITISSLWAPRAHEIIGQRKFDQVWLELTHTPFNDHFYSWLRDLAPVRVGFLLESANYSPQELQRHPFLWNRKKLIEKRLKSLTHLVVCDEKDQNLVNIPAMWWPQAVPKRFILQNVPPDIPRAIFSGAVYGERKAWLENPNLKNLLIKQGSCENQTTIPERFNALHQKNFLYMNIPWPMPENQYINYLSTLREIRQESFKLWIQSLRQGCAVVNLPHLVKTYAGRVVESMAAGVPVISWEIPERPQNKKLFTDGKEILLFDKNNPEELIQHIEFLKNSPSERARLTACARDKVLKHHTIEKRVEQILNWIDNKEQPHYE